MCIRDSWLRHRSCTVKCNRTHSVPPHMAHLPANHWEKPEDPRVDEEGNISGRPSKRDCRLGCCKKDGVAFCHNWLAHERCTYNGCYKAHSVPPGMRNKSAQYWAKRSRVKPDSIQPVRSLAASSSQPSVPEVISLLEDSQWSDSDSEPGAEPEPKPIARVKRWQC